MRRAALPWLLAARLRVRPLASTPVTARSPQPGHRPLDRCPAGTLHHAGTGFRAPGLLVPGIFGETFHSCHKVDTVASVTGYGQTKALTLQVVVLS